MNKCPKYDNLIFDRGGSILSGSLYYYRLGKLEGILAQFSDGVSVGISETMSAEVYMRYTGQIAGIAEQIEVAESSKEPQAVALALEFVLEGLHLNERLSKTELEDKKVYRH